MKSKMGIQYLKNIKKKRKLEGEYWTLFKDLLKYDDSYLPVSCFILIFVLFFIWTCSFWILVVDRDLFDYLIILFGRERSPPMGENNIFQ